jgi:hypothetical protein
MQATSWKPNGKAVDADSLALSQTIRSHLPDINLYNQPGWLFGTSILAPEASRPTVAPRVQLKTLSWRQIEAIDWQRRACARGVFSGQAWVQGRLIDFTGDNVRDLATGGYLEFQLLTMGVRGI